MARVQEMGKNSVLGVSGREEGEMSWKEAIIGSGRYIVERSKKYIWVQEANVKTWEETCCDG